MSDSGGAGGAASDTFATYNFGKACVWLAWSLHLFTAANQRPDTSEQQHCDYARVS